jgi:hypothetical protein
VPEPMDRETFLAHVAARLDIPGDAAQEAIDELRGHLEDTAAGLREGGEPGVDAERRAVARMGDPDSLGRELTRSYRARRPLLSVIGGSVWAAGAEAVRAWFLVLIVLAIAGLLGLVVATAILGALDRVYGSLLTGRIASVSTVLLSVTAFASVGWTLPARITDLSGRPFERVRPVVAVAGFLASSAILWFAVNLELDDLLAVGLPVGPVAFLLVAARAPEERPYRPGVLTAVALGLALVVPTALLAIGSALAAPQSAGWTTDLSTLGITQEDAGLEGIDATVSWDTWNGGRAETLDFGVQDITDGTPRPDRLRAEVWRASVGDGVLRLEPVPLVATEHAFGDDVSLRWLMPTLRTPVETVRTLVAVMPDGSRVLLDQDLDLRPTPRWNGTLAAWWFGP